MSKPGLFPLCIVCLFFAAITGCSSRQPTIIVIPRTTATPLWESLHLGVAEVARGSGFHIYWNAPSDEADPEKQLNLLAAGENQHPSGVIFAPNDILALRSAVLQLETKHIPAVIVDDELGPLPGPLLSYVTSDEQASGDLAAQQVATILRGHGAIAIIGISGTLESGASRESSFESALSRRAPGIHIVERRFKGSMVALEQKFAQEVLDGPNHIDAIVALSDMATRGALYAKLASDSHASIPIVGFDQESLIPIQAGAINAVIAQDTRTIGQIAMKNLEAEMRGEKVSGTTKVPPILLTRQTIHSPNVARLWEFSQYRWSDQ